MADTARTLAALQTLLADNTSGDISAQDVRDFLVSCYQPQAVNGFRLTLTSGVPVTVSDVTGATSVYLTPYVSNCIGVYDGSSWKQYTSAELTLALGTLTSGKNYDVFLYDNAGTLTLILGPAWTSDTARGTGAGTTELVTQDGVYVNKVSISGGPGAKAGRYLGTLRTTATTTTEDSGGGSTTQVGGKRFLWNMYHRRPRFVAVKDTTQNWSYSGATWRAGNNTAGNKVEMVRGLDEDPVWFRAEIPAYLGAGNYLLGVGIGLDRSNGNDAQIFGYVYGGAYNPCPTVYRGLPGLGYHYLQWVEYGDNGSTTYYGNGNGVDQSGCYGEVWA